MDITKLKTSEDYNYLYPHHRYGWRKAIEEVSKLTNNNAKVYLEPFLERVFGYKREDIHRVEIYKKNPWVAFVHEPASTGIVNSSLAALLLTEDLKECLPNLKGIFCLTQNQKEKFDTYPALRGIPISVVQYPTCYEVPQWDINKLNYDVYEIGSHYRMPVLINVRLRQARDIIILKQKEKKITDKEYDIALSSSIIVQKYYYLTAASTTIVECMAACNPLFVNKAKSIVEYLGEDYPNYYNTTIELYNIFKNKDKLNERLISANEYLKKKRPLNYKNFIKQIIESEVYNTL